MKMTILAKASVPGNTHTHQQFQMVWPGITTEIHSLPLAWAAESSSRWLFSPGFPQLWPTGGAY